MLSVWNLAVLQAQFLRYNSGRTGNALAELHYSGGAYERQYLLDVQVDPEAGQVLWPYQENIRGQLWNVSYAYVPASRHLWSA